MLLQVKYFRKSSINGMAWMRKVDPSKFQGQKVWLKLEAQDSTFYILVIQDHIESIGKANTIKEG